MTALILNSGTGSRMGDLTASRPKCMTQLAAGETILSRQITLLERFGITNICITTGPFKEELEKHAKETAKAAQLIFAHNPEYAATNYIYSIFLAREFLRGDILLLHGDLVFSDDVLDKILKFKDSAVVVQPDAPLPDKDFKAVIQNGRIRAAGVEFFDSAYAMQPMYKLNKQDWFVWLGKIEYFIAEGKTRVYAEDAFNAVSDSIPLYPLYIKDSLCAEIDTKEDLERINAALARAAQGRLSTARA